MYLSPFLHLPRVWGWIMEEGMDLWPNETNQRGSLSASGWIAGLLGSLPLASFLLTLLLSCSRAVWCCRTEGGTKASLSSGGAIVRSGRQKACAWAPPFLPVAPLPSEG